MHILFLLQRFNAMQILWFQPLHLCMVTRCATDFSRPVLHCQYFFQCVSGSKSQCIKDAKIGSVHLMIRHVRFGNRLSHIPDDEHIAQ